MQGHMIVALGSDHGGYDLKQKVIGYLKEKEIEYRDFGCESRESCDYPEYGRAAAEAVAKGECDFGIVICTTGIGISIVANKVKGIRACVCSEPYTAKLSRVHNNSNVLAFGARVVGSELAKMITEAWLDAEFEGGRHERRVNMIMDIENS